MKNVATILLATGTFLMAINTKRVRILLYGTSFFRDYRSKILVKFLQNSGYCISQVNPDFYRSNIKFAITLCWIELFLKAAFADMIYLPPMNAVFIKSAIWASKIFNKKLVVEMYISLYDTYVNDRKIVDNKSKEAKYWMEKDILALTKADYIIHTAAHEINYWEDILSINIDRNKVFIAPVCNVSTFIAKRNFMQDSVLNICWWGTFIPLHGLDNILQAMKILKEKELRFTCTLLGVDKPAYYTYTEKIKLDNLEDHVFLRKDLSFPDGSLPEYLVNNCDLALGIFGNTDKAHSTLR